VTISYPKCNIKICKDIIYLLFGVGIELGPHIEGRTWIEVFQNRMLRKMPNKKTTLTTVKFV
jgi:hypothetical protein